MHLGRRVQDMAGDGSDAQEEDNACGAGGEEGLDEAQESTASGKQGLVSGRWCWRQEVSRSRKAQMQLPVALTQVADGDKP